MVEETNMMFDTRRLDTVVKAGRAPVRSDNILSILLVQSAYNAE